jgi:hypothetical protein
MLVVGPTLGAACVARHCHVFGLRQVIATYYYLVPRTLLYFPMVSLTAGTSGWFLVDWLGYTVSASPMYRLTLISLLLVAVMTVQGLGFLLPNSLRIWSELRRPEPDREGIVRINRINIWLAGMQGVLQIAIIFVMAQYVS